MNEKNQTPKTREMGMSDSLENLIGGDLQRCARARLCEAAMESILPMFDWLVEQEFHAKGNHNDIISAKVSFANGVSEILERHLIEYAKYAFDKSPKHD